LYRVLNASVSLEIEKKSQCFSDIFRSSGYPKILENYLTVAVGED